MTERPREGAAPDTPGAPRTADVARLLRCAAVFLPGPVPRDGRIAFWDPLADAGPWQDDGAPELAGASFAYADASARPDTVPYTSARLTVARPDDAAGPGGVRTAEVPAALLSVADALPLLVRARQQASAHPATRCWGAAALHALHLVARGRLLPGLTADGHDAWRAGPSDAEDVAHLRAVAAALPPEGHAVPVPGSAPPRLPAPEALTGAFLDAVADTLPRTPAAAFAMGAPFAAREPQHLPQA
ncbi:ATP-dependent helicase, partial [Streptomyces sindenensis]